MEKATNVERHEIHNAAENRAYNAEQIESVNPYNTSFPSLAITDSYKETGRHDPSEGTDISDSVNESIMRLGVVNRPTITIIVEDSHHDLADWTVKTKSIS